MKSIAHLFLAACALMLPHIGLAQVAPAQFNSVKDIIATVPRQSIIALQGGGKRAEPAAIQASEFLKTTAVTKVASLRIRVLKVERAPGVAHAWRILAADETVRAAATSILVKLIAYFSEAQTAAVAKVKTGEQITVVGKMSRCDLTSVNKLELHIDLDETVIQ